MSTYLYKAVNRDYTSRNGLRWDVGTVVTHPTSTAMVRDEPSTYLSLSTEPAETLIGRGWPCRLERVEPLGEVIDSDRHPHKRCVLSARVVDEIEPWRALGANGRQTAALIERCGTLTESEVDAAWAAARATARTAARTAARATAARATARVAAGAAAWDAATAARATVVRDLITTEQYDRLVGPLVSVVGPIENLPVPAWVDEIPEVQR